MAKKSKGIMSYCFAPLSSLWSSFDYVGQAIGYSRAAAELARQGYIEEARHLMLEKSKLEEERFK